MPGFDGQCILLEVIILGNKNRARIKCFRFSKGKYFIHSFTSSCMTSIKDFGKPREVIKDMLYFFICSDWVATLPPIQLSFAN